MKFRVGQHKMRNGFSATIHEETRDGKLLGILTYYNERIPGVWNTRGEFVDAIGFAERVNMILQKDAFNLSPTKHEIWVNVYKSDTGYVFESCSERSTSDKVALPSRIACLRLEFEEGAGIEHLLSS